MKLYATEIGTEHVRELVGAAELIATSLLSYVEVQSAFARKRRLAQINAVDVKRCSQEFERDWLGLHRLPVDEALVRKAGELCEKYALRAYDALHLATADFLRTILGAPVVFACFDNILNRAARTHNFETLIS